MLDRLKSLVDFDVPTNELLESAEGYVREVDKAIDKKLEQRYDTASEGSEEMPSGEAMITEIEEYLKSQQPPEDLDSL